MSKFSSPVLPVTDGPLSTVLTVVYKELASKGMLPLQLFFLLNFIKISKNIFFFIFSLLLPHFCCSGGKYFKWKLCTLTLKPSSNILLENTVF